MFHLHRYTSENTGVVVSPRQVFPTLPESHVVVQEIFEVTYDPALLPKGIHPKAKVDEIYQGFPTLKSIEHVVSKKHVFLNECAYIVKILMK